MWCQPLVQHSTVDCSGRQCKIAITKSPGMFLIHLHRPHSSSSLSAFALSRMYLSGFKCPGSSYWPLSKHLCSAFMVSPSSLTQISCLTGRGVSCSNKPVLYHGAPLPYKTWKCFLPLFLPQWSRKACGCKGQWSSWIFSLFQGVHESKGVTEDYLKLESLIQKVVSPYLGTYGLYSSDGPFMHSSCILGKNNRGSTWHSTEGFTKTLVHTGPGPTRAETASTDAIQPDSCSKVLCSVQNHSETCQWQKMKTDYHNSAH